MDEVQEAAQVEASLDALGTDATAEQILQAIRGYSENAIQIALRRLGGGTPPSAASVRLSTTAEGIATNTNIPFDEVLEDTDGYFNAGTFVIPTGLAGLFLCGCVLNTSAPAAATTIQAQIRNSGDDININQSFTLATSGGANGILQLADGDTISARLVFNGGGTADVFSSNTGLWITKIT